eukprot:3230442-Alexandrium_andersonii.AAC.1
MVSQKSSFDELEQQVRDLSAENAGLRDQYATAIDDLTEWQQWYEVNKDWVDAGPNAPAPEEEPGEEDFQDPEEEEAEAEGEDSPEVGG